MTLWEKFKNWLHQKTWPNWRPIGGGSVPTGTDFWGRPDPTNAELIKAFNDTTFAVITLIANQMADARIRLYVTSDKGQARPKCDTRPISRKTLNYLRTKHFGTSADIEEVICHPILDLLNRCNSNHNWVELITLSEIYLDVCGNSCWWAHPDAFGVPCELYLLPTQTTEPIKSEDGYIEGWRVTSGNKEKDYPLNEVIHFKTPNPSDPYGLGYSPLQAAWNRISIGNSEMGYLSATLQNMGRPDAILSPDQPISPFEAERLAKDFFQRFRGGGNGGIVVADGPMKLSPLNFPPRDLAEFELYKSIKMAVANVFQVPPDLFEIGQANRSSAEAVLYQLAVHCIKPRINLIVSKLNEKLIPMFDRSGRLHFEADSPVPEDKAFLLQENQMLVTTCSITRDELRQRYGFDSADWAKQPLTPPGSLPPEALVPQETAAPAPMEIDRSGQAPSLAALQQLVYSGQLPRIGAINNVVLTFGYSREQAEALFPDVPPVKTTPAEAKSKTRTKAIRRKSPQLMAEALVGFFRRQKSAITEQFKSIDTKAIGDNWFDLDKWSRQMFDEMRPIVAMYAEDAAKKTVSRIGANWDLLKVSQPKLKEGVDKATMIFCEETNATTSQEIGAAVKQLRQSLAEGLEHGEYNNQLMKRVGEIFDTAEVNRSWRIAVTEANRAQHAAQFTVAKESGIVQGKGGWILSADACDKCKPMAGKTVPLDGIFTTVDFGNPAYSAIQFPPLHPGCRCDAIEVIEGVND